jgi:sphingolipid delta-4 desaturase
MESSPPTRGRQFTHVDYPEPHRDRARQILKDHPEVRQLFGRQPLSAPLTIGIVAFQVALAIALRNQPWWLVIGVAWLVGAWATHTLWVLIHEATHNLMVESKPVNRALGIIANLPMLVPSAESFRIYHLKHHKFQGDYELDADLPSHWEAKLVGSSVVGKLLWQLFFPVFQSLRVIRFSKAGNISFFTPGVMINLIASFAFDAAIVYFFGWPAALYLGMSLVFSIGPHPVGARWVQEHYLTWDHDQETGSYYGPANILALNVGYHNEHHDFPFIPWHKLPALKKLAPEMYDTLDSYKSYTKLWIQFLTTPTITLFSRVTRDGEVNLRRVEIRERARAVQTAVPAMADASIAASSAVEPA